jgi:hypothetical protein
MSGFEAMSGILLFGWSTAMLFSIVQKVLSELFQKVLNKETISL